MKDEIYIELFDIYGNLLTEKQRETFSSKYLYDLSLSESAEMDGKTRQSVYEAIKVIKEKLDRFECVLKIREKTVKLKELALKVKEKDAALSDKITEVLEK